MRPCPRSRWCSRCSTSARRSPGCWRACPRRSSRSWSTTDRPTGRPRWPAGSAPGSSPSRHAASVPPASPACRPATRGRRVLHGLRRIARPCGPHAAGLDGAGRGCRPRARGPDARARVLAGACPGGQPVPGLAAPAPVRLVGDRPGADARGRARALLGLHLTDRRSGWPLEMVVRAGQAGWRVAEVPVPYGIRSGRSKVTGTVAGTAHAVSDMRAQLRELG